jgi:hypothetical protein
VGWETRERGKGAYYYRVRRDGERIRKGYCGNGRLGQLAAQLDEIERRQRAETAAYWKGERERLEREAVFLRELEEAAEVLAQAHLIAAGYHKHKGEWRRRREQSA